MANLRNKWISSRITREHYISIPSFIIRDYLEPKTPNIITNTITAIAIKLVNEFSDSNTRSGSTPA